MAKNVAEHADAVVVGSALVKRVLTASSQEESLKECGEFINQLAQALR